WYRNLRETVRFEQAVRAVAERATILIEASPHPVLTVAAEQTVGSSSEVSGEVAVLGSLRRDDGSAGRLVASVAEAFVNGAGVEWGALLDSRRARAGELPTYAFQHRRVWVPTGGVAGDAGALGLAAGEHPLLGAMVPLADAEGVLFTGRLSLETSPWLADHAVLGTVLLPGSAFLELALHAAGRMD